MSSIYDEIGNTYDLIVHVKLHGLSTKPEDILRAQDILGHEPIHELVKLANNVIVVGDRIPTRDLLYFVMFKIWGWEDAVRFWNQHTNPDTEKYRKCKEELQAAQKTIEMLGRNAEMRKTAHDVLVEERNQIIAEKYQFKDELKARDHEILVLKAKLYDLMAAQKEA